MSDIAGIISRVWPEWTIEKQIGRGAFGQVFQAVRGELGFETRCAVKAVEVPPDDSETDALRLEGMTEEEIRQYFRRQAESFVGEIRMLDSLKGAPHIVGIEDFRVVEQEDGLSWVILIRMELLTPFPVYVRSAPMTEAETVRLGIELCKAMEICHGLHVIHRDIKPQNIFVDRFGSFRLGDFGIARKMESLTNSMSKKGTYGYLAPEIDSGLHYDERVDIYSLGLVMYQLVNENRMPFLSTPEDARNPEKRSSAMSRRLRGEPLPPPCAASPALADVILKACRYDPNDRFRTASDMKNALLVLESGAEADLAHAPQIPVKPAETVPEEPHPAAEAAPEEPADDEATLSPRSAMRKRAAEASEKTAARDEDTERTVRAASKRTRTGSDGSARKSSGKKPGPGKKQILIAVLALVLLAASVWGTSAALSRKDDGPEASAQTDESGDRTPEDAPVDAETPGEGQTHAVLVETEGSGTAEADRSEAAAGDTVTLRAAPAEGYYLREWKILSGGAEVKDNAVTVGTEDVRILAVFEPKQSWLALAKPADAQVDARFFTTVEEKWFKAYSAKMDEFIGYCPDARFGFIHLDSDHIPELVCCGREKVQYETWLPDSYTPDSMVDYYDVYTIRNGQVESPAFCYGGPFEYVARSGRYRFLHLYAAFSMDYYIYDNMIDQEFGNDGYVVRDPDLTGGKTSVLVIGFEDPDPVLGGWSERTLSADQYLELMKTYYPVTADALEDVEVSGASYTVRRDLLTPKSELNILILNPL